MPTSRLDDQQERPRGAQATSMDVENKMIAILRILSESPEPLGSITIARQLERYGVFLSERAVRYYLRITDERGYTQPRGRDGRAVTSEGLEELRMALAPQQVGFIVDRLELLAFQTTFDPRTKTGQVPVNTSLFQEDKFDDALAAMRCAFEAGICVSQLVAVASQGEKLGEVVVPEGKIGLATVCSVVINGVLLKACVPIESKFGGVLEVIHYRPRRFVAIINYAGTSLDPSEQYIRAKMTDVAGAASGGHGKILANFREIVAPSRAIVQDKVAQLKEAGINGMYVLGNTSEPVCQIAVHMHRIGMVLLGGLNPIAAAAEAGIEVENIAESGLVDFQRLRSYRDLFNK